MPSTRNQTLTCSTDEVAYYDAHIKTLDHALHAASKIEASDLLNSVVNQDFFTIANLLPTGFVDLLFLDPPYNISKQYNGIAFNKKEQSQYRQWFDLLIQKIVPTLKEQASIYVCADWKTSILIAPVLSQHFIIQNRITWERSKGRGAKNNWKNNMEDIWFCTNSSTYYFNAEAVKIRRKVVAPYKAQGKPKDWQETEGGNFRMTYPPNIWTDITIPFWSMPENTNHPTQKPEKLVAKIILSSSREGDVVLDPFLGSGTTAVVARKLNRNFVGIEIDREYCCWALKRLAMAAKNTAIQGYRDNIFWERNSVPIDRG